MEKKKEFIKYAVTFFAGVLVTLGVVVGINFISEAKTEAIQKTPPTDWMQDDVYNITTTDTVDGCIKDRITKKYVVSEVYAGDKIVQRSILVRETGNIFYYEFSENPEGELTVYNMDDFRVKDE